MIKIHQHGIWLLQNKILPMAIGFYTCLLGINPVILLENQKPLSFSDIWIGIYS